MKEKDQLAPLNLCKRLHELGVEKWSRFFHVLVPVTNHWEIRHIRELTHLGGDRVEYRGPHESYDIRQIESAFSVAELGLMLSVSGMIPHTRYTEHGFVNVVWWETEFANAIYVTDTDPYFRTEAEARAVMLVYLLETGKVNIKDVNKRLTQKQTANV